MNAILSPSNRLFVLARQGKRQPSAPEAIAVVLILIVLAIAGQILTRLVVRLAVPVGIQSITGPIVEGTVGFLPVYLGLWVWLRLSNKRPFRTLGFETPGVLRRVLGGTLAAGLMIAAAGGLAIIPGVSVEPGTQTSGLAALGIGLLSLLSYAVQGPAEEALFRGWLLPVIGARYGPWIGVLVSALLFGLVHLPNTGLTPQAPLELLNLFLFGVFAAFYALAEGGLWGVSAWHAVWNWAMGNLLGFAVSGSAHSGLLVSLRPTGPAMITGGAFGPEGGIAVTVVLLIAISWRSSAARRLAS